jgi:hypothetical protein
VATIKNRAAFLALEPDGLDVDELWRLTGYVRCGACSYLMHTESPTASPEHYCTQRQARRRAHP